MRAIYIGVIILGDNTLYMIFCLLKETHGVQRFKTQSKVTQNAQGMFLQMYGSAAISLFPGEQRSSLSFYRALGAAGLGARQEKNPSF